MRRNILRTFLAAMLLSAAFTVTAHAESAVVTGSGVNFRSGPGTSYYIIATLDRGTTVEVTNRSDASWYAVSYGGQSGFIAASYLDIGGGSVYTTIPSYDTGGLPQPDSGGGGYGGGTVYNIPGSGSSGDSTTILPDGYNVYNIPGSGSADNTGDTGSASTPQAGYINAMYVRFRSGPGSSYSVLNEYNKGKAVSVYTSANGWTACVIDGQAGYVSSQYVSLGTYSGGSGTVYYIGGDNSVYPVSTPVPVPTANVIQPAPTATPQPTVNPSTLSGTPGYIVGSYVRFRSGPGTNYSILGSYNTGKTVNVVQNMGNGWLYCVIDNVAGYVHGSYVLVMSQASYGDGTAPAATPQPTQAPAVTPAPTAAPGYSGSGTAAYIAGNNVRFRASPSMTSQIITELFYGNEVVYYGTSGEWAAITYQGQSGYVYAQYVQSGTYSGAGGSGGSAGGGSGSSGSSGQYGTGADVANYALQFVGYNYCWGGSSPETGFDCSGLVYYVYKQFGYPLNRVAQDQALNGVHVDPSAIQPGDILCFYSGSSYIGHVGIYIGSGKFVHSSNSTTGVIISDLSGYYSSRGYEARRIIY